MKIRRYNLFCGVFGICALYLTLYSNYYLNISDNSVTDDQNFVNTLLNTSKYMIELEMRDYDYSQSNVRKLEDLTMESGGNPIRTVIVSAWRSGSNFFGDFLNAVPGSFYSHEPLAMIDIDHLLRSPSSIAKGYHLIKHLLQCAPEADVMDYYKFALTFKERIKTLFHNRRFYEKCKLKPQLCGDGNFGMKMCRVSPFHVIKLDRMTLPGLEFLLQNKEFNSVKLLLLVRDPRGVLQSRMHTSNDICYKHIDRDNRDKDYGLIADCADPAVVCDDMVTNYKTAANFLQKYPGRLIVVRYEDMVMNLDVKAPEVLRFLKIDFTQSISDFLKTHTNATNEDNFSTFRISRNVPFKWKHSMKFDDLQKIQSECSYAMSLWGYKLAQNATHMTSDDFYPLLPYKIIK